MQFSSFRILSLSACLSLLIPFSTIQAASLDEASVNAIAQKTFDLLVENAKKAPVEQTPALPTTISWTKPGIALACGLGLLIYGFAQLKYKKTEPKRVYPKDGSIEEQLKFLHNELFIGQQYYAERLSGQHEDPENPEHTIYEYTKIPARGLIGQADYYLKNVINPTVILALAYLTFKKNIKENIDEFTKIIKDPMSFVSFAK